MTTPFAFAQSGSRDGGGSHDGIQVDASVRQVLAKILRFYETQHISAAVSVLKKSQTTLRVIIGTDPTQPLVASKPNGELSTLVINLVLWDDEPSLVTKVEKVSTIVIEQLQLPQLDRFLSELKTEELNLYWRRSFRCLIGDQLITFSPAQLQSSPLLLKSDYQLQADAQGVWLKESSTQVQLPLSLLQYPLLFGADADLQQTLHFVSGALHVSCE